MADILSKLMPVVIAIFIFGALVIQISGWLVGPNTASYASGGNLSGTPITILGVIFILFVLGVMISVYKAMFKGR